MSRMNFSNDAVSPPSSQPAACKIKLQPPNKAPHKLICDSYAACASGALPAVALEQRQGTRMCLASWPAPKAAFVYSGVPNAGDPDFMSTFEVKLPYITGAPGCTTWVSVIPNRASACASVKAPAIVMGAIAPASVNGVTITSCPFAAKSMMPSVIGTSSCRGEFVLQMV